MRAFITDHIIAKGTCMAHSIITSSMLFIPLLKMSIFPFLFPVNIFLIFFKSNSYNILLNQYFTFLFMLCLYTNHGKYDIKISIWTVMKSSIEVIAILFLYTFLSKFSYKNISLSFCFLPSIMPNYIQLFQSYSITII